MGRGPHFVSVKEMLMKALRIPGTPTQLALRIGRNSKVVSAALAELRKEGKVFREEDEYKASYYLRKKGAEEPSL